MNATVLDPRSFRDFFGQLPTGVTAIVTHTPDGPRGLVVGTFSSVSLDPPLVSFMVKTGSRAWSAIQAQGRFTANILASDQLMLSQKLAGWSPEKFSDVAFAPGPDDALVIRESLAWATCRIDQEIAAGDHTIILAVPSQLTVLRPSARPLVYYQGAYHRTLRVQEVRPPGWA